MTKIKQDKRTRPAAVELHDDALDRVAGGAEVKYSSGANFVFCDGSIRSITDGTSNIKA